MNVLNFESKQCDRIRSHFDAYLSNELLVETTSEVLKHLETCEACSAELDSRMRLREALRRAAVSQSAPDGLREAIHERLRAVQPGDFTEFPNTGWFLAAAASVIVILAAAASQEWLRVRSGREVVSSVLAVGVSDHLQCAIKGHNYPEVANPPDQLRAKLGPEYAGLLQVVEAKLPGFQVLEAHICSVPGSPRKYVHFITRGRGTILSVILTRREGKGLPSGRFLVAGNFGGVNLYKAHLDAVDVAGFEAKDYFGFVVSDLGQNKVLEIAVNLAPAMRNALGGTVGTAESETPATALHPDRFLRGMWAAAGRTNTTGADLSLLTPVGGWNAET